MSDSAFAAALEARDDESSDEEEVPDNIVVCEIHRLDKGYGFNIKGPTALGGKMQSIAGKLYPPLQYISAVEEAGAAYRGGLRKHDRVLSVNGVDVQGKSHQSIVQAVVNGGDNLVLKVVRIDAVEAARLQNLEDVNEGAVQPTAKKLTSKLSVEAFTDNLTPKPHTVFHIWCDSKVVAKKRYSEFDTFYRQLLARFRWFDWASAPFPAKQLNGLWKTTLNEKQKQARCDELNQWLKIVMGCEDILKSTLTSEFVTVDFSTEAAPVIEEGGKKVKAGPTKVKRSADGSSDATEATDPVVGAKSTKNLFGATLFDEVPDDGADDGAEAEEEVNATASAEPEPEPVKVVTKVGLAGGKKLKLEFPDQTNVRDAEKLVAERLALGPFASRIFGLFESIEGKLVKLPAKKLVSQASGQLVYRKWLFTKKQEVNIEDDETAVTLLCRQIKEDITSGALPVDETTRDKLVALEADELKYLKTTRKLRTYGLVAMKPCTCDYPNPKTTVVVGLQLQRLTLSVCDADGTPIADEDDDGQTEFQWEMISSWEMSSDKKSILVKYKTDDDDEGGGEETITLLLKEQVPYFKRCVARIMQEREWLMEFLESETTTLEGNFFVAPKKK